MSVNLNLISIIKSGLCPSDPLTSTNLNYVTDWGPFTSINLNYVPNWSNYHAYKLALDFCLETKLYPWKYFISIVRIKSSKALRPWPMFSKKNSRVYYPSNMGQHDIVCSPWNTPYSDTLRTATLQAIYNSCNSYIWQLQCLKLAKNILHWRLKSSIHFDALNS